MRKHWSLLLIAMLFLATAAALAKADPDAKRAAIDGMARESLTRLFEESDGAGALFDRATGYAVFDNFKVALLFSGGGGVGVAVDKASGNKTYMKMGTAGIGLGLGGQSYQVVFLFEDSAAFERFVNKGWQGGAGARAVAGTSGKNVASTFSNGVAIYVMTHKGLMASADVAGTKYWKSKKLNR